MITWKGDDSDNDKIQRTKFFINILKIRLSYHRPDKCSELIRSEAHVRFSSTTWYLAQIIRKISDISLIISTLLLILSIFRNNISVYPSNLDYFVPLIVVIVLILIMTKLIHTIENFFHYQRVRGILYVLETAYTFFREKPNQAKDIFPELYEIIIQLN